MVWKAAEVTTPGEGLRTLLSVLFRARVAPWPTLRSVRFELTRMPPVPSTKLRRTSTCASAMHLGHTETGNAPTKLPAWAGKPLQRGDKDKGNSLIADNFPYLIKHGFTWVLSPEPGEMLSPQPLKSDVPAPSLTHTNIQSISKTHFDKYIYIYHT